MLARRSATGFLGGRDGMQGRCRAAGAGAIWRIAAWARGQLLSRTHCRHSVARVARRRRSSPPP